MPGKYRFTLQWGAETAEKIRAGDFLGGLGNRKSELVVLAVTDYLDTHPEAAAGGKLKIVVQPNYTREQVETIVRAIIDERLAGAQAVGKLISDDGAERSAIEPDIDEMLKNLDLFS